MEHGIEGDAHAGPWHRQVSLLAQESIDKMTAAGLNVGPGDFAENITTLGLEVAALPIGTILDLGDALVEVTQIGKECHTRCAIYQQAGDCVMPREGIFVRVLRGGRVAAGDAVQGPCLGVRRVNEKRLATPIRAAVVTLSDKASAGLRADASGPLLCELLGGIGAVAREAVVIPDDRATIESTLAAFADSGEIDLILTTGGTGLAPRDRTPEATLAVADRLAPGFAEAMRAASLAVTPHAMLSRAVSAVQKRDAHHQHARQSQGLPGALRRHRAGPRPRYRDPERRSIRVRSAGCLAERVASAGGWVLEGGDGG